jgi:hypothetical protein
LKIIKLTQKDLAAVVYLAMVAATRSNLIAGEFTQGIPVTLVE